jgi:hypothetical protein
VHPNALGMKGIAEVVVDALADDTIVTAGTAG